MATTYQVFEAAERVEVLSAAIYAALSRRFASDPDARALFARLEAEELQHASRVRLLAARYRHDPRLLEKLEVDARALDELAAEAEAVLRLVRADEWAEDLAEAKRTLAALEDRFSLAHAQLLAGAAHPALRDFFEQLAAQDAGHRELLRDRQR